MTTRETPGDTDDAVELLSSPPTNDDLDDLLEAAAPRRRSKLTIVLLAALIFLLGFLAGSIAEKIAVSIQEAQSTEADETVMDNGAESNSALIGRVVMLDDDVVYVERSDGATVKVNINDATIIGLSNAGEIGDLVPGGEVIIHGETSADGTVEASSIQQTRPPP